MSYALLRSRVSQVAAFAFQQPRCGLKLKTEGVEYYWKDYPYEAGALPNVFDRPQYRQNENSKSIAVEGNVAVGKGAFARGLADLCDLKFVKDVSDDDFFVDKNYKPPLDYRDYNPILPKRFQFYTTEMMYTDPDPIKQGKPLYTQQSYYMYRFYNWWKSCAHLFHTGQGFVTQRSPFSTYIFAKAMAETGLLSKDAAEWFEYYDKNLSPTLYRPHLFVYLRAPVSTSRRNLQARSVPFESRIGDRFLEVMKQVYEQEFLPRMQRYSEVFVVDVDDYNFADANDLTYLAEEICKLDLDQTDRSMDVDEKLLQWRKATYNSDSMLVARGTFARSHGCVKLLATVRVPEEMPEGGLTLAEANQLRQVLERDERQRQWWPLNPSSSKRAVDLALGRVGLQPMEYKFTYDEDPLKRFAIERNHGRFMTRLGHIGKP